MTLTARGKMATWCKVRHLCHYRSTPFSCEKGPAKVGNNQAKENQEFVEIKHTETIFSLNDFSGENERSSSISSNQAWIKEIWGILELFNSNIIHTCLLNVFQILNKICWFSSRLTMLCSVGWCIYSSEHPKDRGEKNSSLVYKLRYLFLWSTLTQFLNLEKFRKR